MVNYLVPKLQFGDRTNENHINTTIEKIGGFVSRVRDVEDEINTKLAYNQQWDKQIDETAAKLEEMKNACSMKIAKLKQGNFLYGMFFFF